MVKKINPKYLPKSLTPSDRKKQLKSIQAGTDRPKLKSYKSKRSSHAVNFENKYKTKITDINFVKKNIIRKEGIDKILSKGRGAYYSSGSRPNQTPSSWARGRIYAYIMGGKKVRKVDKSITDKYKVKFKIPTEKS